MDPRSKEGGPLREPPKTNADQSLPAPRAGVNRKRRLARLERHVEHWQRVYDYMGARR